MPFEKSLESSSVPRGGKGPGESLLLIRPDFAAPPKFRCAVSRFHYSHCSCYGDRATNIWRPVTPPSPPPGLVKNVWDRASAHQTAVCSWMQPLWPVSWRTTRLQRDDSTQIFLNSVCVSCPQGGGRKPYKTLRKSSANAWLSRQKCCWGSLCKYHFGEPCKVYTGTTQVTSPWVCPYNCRAGEVCALTPSWQIRKFMLKEGTQVASGHQVSGAVRLKCPAIVIIMGKVFFLDFYYTMPGKLFEASQLVQLRVSLERKRIQWNGDMRP